jgi:hypothetical protein
MNKIPIDHDHTKISKKIDSFEHPPTIRVASINEIFRMDRFLTQSPLFVMNHDRVFHIWK